MLKTLKTLNKKEISMSRTKVIKVPKEKPPKYFLKIIEETSKEIDKSFKVMKFVVARRFK